LIAILDYGSGNLRSAERAFATSGHDVVVTADRKIALEASGLVIPGVGAFAACMSGLKSVAGDEIARERVALGRPTLGICIGMQILFESGLEHAENGAHQGVGIWPGMVKKLSAPILPHMGWNTVVVAKENPLISLGHGEQRYYFVHSYHVVCNDKDDILATGTHGFDLTAAFRRDNIFGVQFHPEKSHRFGMELMRRFLEY
jgi:glutamine amidotransferase